MTPEPEPARDQHAEYEAQRDDRHDRDAERGACSQQQREIDRDPENRHRELEHLLAGEPNTRLESRARSPYEPHEHADEQRDDERLDDRRPEEPCLETRDRNGCRRDCRGDENARDYAAQRARRARPTSSAAGAFRRRTSVTSGNAPSRNGMPQYPVPGLM